MAESKIYLGNLEYSVIEDDIQKFCEEKGIQTKSVQVIKDKYTGRSKGFAFAELESDEMRDKAIEVLDGQDLKGRKLKVSQAKKQEEKKESPNLTVGETGLPGIKIG